MVSSKTANNDSDIMEMPYIRFLCYVHYLQRQEYEAYKRQIEMFAPKQSQAKSVPKHQTEPDMDKIKSLKGGRV